jgi:hypothetical protein
MSNLQLTCVVYLLYQNIQGSVMGLAYLKVAPEEALQIIDQHAVEGYKIKEAILAEYLANKSDYSGLVEGWKNSLDWWTTIGRSKLQDIFHSERASYIYRDAQASGGYGDGFSAVVTDLLTLFDARINKLNYFDADIRENFRVNLEVIIGDKVTQTGGKNVYKK